MKWANVPVEVVWAGGQDHPVGRDCLAIGASETNVDQSVGVQKVLEGGQSVEAVVIPLQVKLLGLHVNFLEDMVSVG